MSTPGDRPGPDATAAELRLIRAEIAAIRQQVIREQETREQVPWTPPAHPQPHVSLPARLAAWLNRKDTEHDHNAAGRASRRRWRTRRRDDRDWQRHHGGHP